MFEERLRLLEGAEACFATASGMSAVFVALSALLGQGDRVVASRGLFGSCFVILDEILPRWGVETVFVDGPDLDQWKDALSEPTAAVFFETPSNPMQELVDMRAVSDLAHAAGAQVVVDNVFGTPVFSRPLEHGADVVVYSATKHIDGQGRTLGGAVLGTRDFVDGPVKNLMRHTGPAMSPFNAWVLVKGLETMSLRVRRQAESALTLARALEAHPRVRRVVYPWLESHPQHELARAQMSGGGTVVTFEIDGGKATTSATPSRWSPTRRPRRTAGSARRRGRPWASPTAPSASPSASRTRPTWSRTSPRPWAEAPSCRSGYRRAR
jgi:O-succinylhomoserine sulfhydrylase